MKRFLLNAVLATCVWSTPYAFATVPEVPATEPSFSVSGNTVLYNKTFVVEGADAATLTQVPGQGYYAYDKQHIFTTQYTRSSIDGAHVTIQRPTEPGDGDCTYLKDPLRVYSICFGYLSPMSKADPATFTPLAGHFSKDAQHAYFDGDAIFGAKADSFKVLGGAYSADADHVFSSTQPLEASPVKFRLINDQYATDGKSVWQYGNLLSIPYFGFSPLGQRYFKSVNNIYLFDNQPLPQVDAASFQEIPDRLQGVGKDKNHVYFSDQILAGADPASFVMLTIPEELASPGTGTDSDYFKDKNAVYHYGEVLKGANPATFTPLSSFVGADDKQVFYGSLAGIPLQGTPRAISDNGGFFTNGTSLFEQDQEVRIPAELKTTVRVDKLQAYKNDMLNFGAILDDGTSLYTAQADENFKPLLHKLPLARDTAQFLNNTYMKDATGVCAMAFETDKGIQILKMDADPKTFVTLSSGFAKDANHVFYNGKTVAGADAVSARLYDETSIVDKHGMWFSDTDKETGFADAATLQSVGYNAAKDSKKVYILEYSTDKEHVVPRAIKDADAASFHLVTDGWSVDKNALYLTAYYVTNSSLYLRLPLSNTGDIEAIQENVVADKHYFYTKSDNTAEDDAAVRLPLRAPGNTTGLEKLTSHFYSNGAGVYFADLDHPAQDGFATAVLVPEAKADTFVSYSYGPYAHDDKNVYYGASIIQGADLATFMPTAKSGGEMEDKNYLYNAGKPTSRAHSIFSDIDDSPYVTSIGMLEDMGIVQGYADGTFRPNSTINRAEFLKIVYEAKVKMGGDRSMIDTCKNVTFKDVAVTAWYAPYICAAKQAGYIQGYPDGTFRPDRTINYVEALKILFQIMNIQVAAPQKNMAWYMPYAQEAEKRNISIKELSLQYDANVTRGQMAALMMNTFMGTPPTPFKN